MTRDAWQAEQKQAKAFANAKAVAASGYRAGIKKAKAEATEIVAQAQESEGVRGQDVRLVLWSSRWLARAKRESQGRGYQGQG